MRTVVDTFTTLPQAYPLSCTLLGTQSTHIPGSNNTLIGLRTHFVDDGCEVVKISQSCIGVPVLLRNPRLAHGTWNMAHSIRAISSSGSTCGLLLWHVALCMELKSFHTPLVKNCPHTCLVADCCLGLEPLRFICRGLSPKWVRCPTGVVAAMAAGA
jgi:hypothetical protein